MTWLNNIILRIKVIRKRAITLFNKNKDEKRLRKLSIRLWEFQMRANCARREQIRFNKLRI